jgi:hypothetical protein
MFMEQIQASDIVDLHQRSNDLIRKLRWIGMEDEAHRLEQAVRSLPPEARGAVAVGPYSTD